ncbi:ComEC family competence protein [Pseudoroseomonas oryzae]|uniref:ComEC family competence protein n=2 Tax=Teichococcus oryzae TaxID=1608942 RepID=A0A5B2TLE9_9PROT|nr:ComEC family competence protein [Pseudoroseomonas oryzae]
MAAALGASLASDWHRLPLWLPVALGAGILFYFGLRGEPSAWWWVLPGPVLALAPLLRGRPALAWMAGLLGTALLGFALAGWHAARMPAPLELPRRAVVLEGVVDKVEMLPKGLRVTLGAAQLGPGEPALPRSLRIRLKADDPLQPVPGERLRVRALVREPSAPAYPGGWDFQRDAFFSGLGGSGFALGPAERVGEMAGPRPFARLRRELERRVTAVLPGGTGAVAAALLTGGQSGIPAENMQAMRDSGLAHLLSVSGLHIAIVMGLGFGLLRFGIAMVPALALRFDSKVAAAPAGLLLGFGYLLLTGLQVPMLRSFAMAAVVTLGVMLGRRALSLRVLAVAAVVVLAMQPAALLGPSFQMSFAAVLVLIAWAEASTARMGRWRLGDEWWRRPLVLLAGMVLTSLLAGLATTPYGLHHFGRLQLYGVAANMVAVPITSFLVMPAGLLAVAAMPFGLEDWPLRLMGLGVDATLWVARSVADWPGAALSAMPIPPAGLALASFGLLWLCLWRARWRLLGVPMLMAGLGSAALVTPPDMLVSGDGKLVALRLEDGLVLQRNSGASGFIRASWLRGLGEDDAEALPASAERRDAALNCEGASCRFQPDAGGPVALLLRAAKPKRGEQAPEIRAEPFCGEAGLLVSSEPIRGRCPGARVVDRFSVWRNGPHAIWLRPGGMRILSDRDWRGSRPWVPPPPVPAARRADAARPLSSGAAARPAGPAP